MQRDMSYDLDGIMATRNQGQLVSSEPTQTKTLRTPGLVQLRGPTPMYVPHGMGDAIDLPVIGPVSKKTLLIGALAIGAFVLYRSKR